MRHGVCIHTTMFALGVMSVGMAQTAPAADPVPAAAPASVWSVGPIEFSGLVDGYYNLNLNHPVDKTNQLRNFDVRANQFSLNMAKLTLEHAADPVGFRVDFGFGRAFDIVHSGEKDLGVMRNVEQAYVSLKPPKGKGLQVDFGKFVTAAGAEVIETNSNWNYSRSLLFSWAIPYYHMGMRTTMPLGKHFTGGFHVVNGWNNVEDNNSGKTFGFMGAFNSSKVTWTNNYMVGPEKSGTNDGYRHLYDTTMLFTPNSKLNAYVNFDYGVDKNVSKGEQRWVGIAVASKLQANNWFALTPRLEWFNDADGFSTGTVQKLKEFTLTGEFKMKEGFFTRVEYRKDWSNVDFFNRGNQTANHGNQDTVLVGMVAYFGPKR